GGQFGPSLLLPAPVPHDRFRHGFDSIDLWLGLAAVPTRRCAVMNSPLRERAPLWETSPVLYGLQRVGRRAQCRMTPARHDRTRVRWIPGYRSGPGHPAFPPAFDSIF